MVRSAGYLPRRRRGCDARLIDSGDQVLAAGWQQGRGRESGVEVSEEIFSVWTVRAGKIIRQRMFRDRDQALEAAGLSE